MRRSTLCCVLSAALGLVAVSAAHADVYKCTGADGKAAFQDKPCAGNVGAKVDVKPNTVGEIDQRSLTAKREAIDKTINARFAADDAYRTLQAAELAEHRGKCRAFQEDKARAGAWSSSRSYTVRQVAAVDWGIAQRKWLEEGCDR